MQSSIDPRIFRAYDIRGRAYEQLTEEACRLIGQAFGSELRTRTRKKSPTVCVGRDARTHSPILESAVINGLLETGCTVYTIGQTPSPLNYFTICTQKLDGGVQLTASHNPAHDNGLKLCTANAEAFAGDDIQTLRDRIEKKDFLSGKGSKKEIDAVTPYKQFVANLFADVGKGMHVVVDGGNGVAGPLDSEILRAVGATVTELYTEPDGTFPNHPADPSKYETLKDLQSLVMEQHAHLGLAFDGDGDRLGLVDETGTIRSADELLLLLAQDHLQRFPGTPVVFTVSNSGILWSEVTQWGGKPVMCKVGHSFVEHAMREHNAQLGGEQSGHFFCGEDYFGFDDALVAALRVLKIINSAGIATSQTFSSFPRVYQTPEQRPTIRDEDKANVIRRMTEHFQTIYPVETLDGARIDFGGGAWAGIRQSNTSPCLSICMEARTPQRLREVEEEVMSHVRQYPEVTL